MIQKLVAAAVFVLLMCAGAIAQTRYDIYPYGGGYFPLSDSSDFGRFRNAGIFGVKGGVVIPSNWEIGGSVGYMNHFEIRPGTGFWQAVAPENRSPVRGLIIEVTGDYNFMRPVFGPKLIPYAGIGLGALTAHVDETANGDNTFFLEGGIPAVPGTNTGTRVIAINNHDSFFTISYGGGIKANRLWRAVGVRTDIRFRTTPNIYGSSVTWPEITAGLTFAWGEH
jgi:hypothetical protein